MKLRFLVPLLSMLLVSSLAIPIAGTFTGCSASQEQAAYRSVGVVESSVHNSMVGWGHYVQSGKATAHEVVAVQTYYEKYQKAMATVETATISATTAPEGQSTLETALKAAEAATGELIALIDALTRN